MCLCIGRQDRPAGGAIGIDLGAAQIVRQGRPQRLFEPLFDLQPIKDLPPFGGIAGHQLGKGGSLRAQRVHLTLGGGPFRAGIRFAQLGGCTRVFRSRQGFVRLGGCLFCSRLLGAGSFEILMRLVQFVPAAGHRVLCALCVRCGFGFGLAAIFQQTFG